MIKVTIYKKTDDLITGFKILGHAGFSHNGNDIVCAAVSALVINTINSIEQFTTDDIDITENEDKGLIEFHVTSPISSETNLLLKSLALGLMGIEAEYNGKYISVSQKVK
ncbi:hypothetical protein DFR55_101175 [Herbinix hemicellulosilytica]|uniref:Ribosomal processing cysteine protease Prp n=1 Tax=Herbinix hemicellulosilytica TaxID=1564487 RepID=A0A0H5SFY5_HERHM|nr:ribosomal-processing cysteine protease Prp [Herbinix hemicellulosilytica]RBP60715.1 hypothetical protein DFR55_101175 [Herbinix hemicellulosilytica]CRZ34402.1 hypothetical protein HHT355_1200 [Herbinix hemicellulosilytica]